MLILVLLVVIPSHLAGVYITIVLLADTSFSSVETLVWVLEKLLANQ